jgi:hypothetical protein
MTNIYSHALFSFLNVFLFDALRFVLLVRIFFASFLPHVFRSRVGEHISTHPSTNNIIIHSFVRTFLLIALDVLFVICR